MTDGSGAGGLKLEVKTVLTKVADTSAAAAGGAEKKSTNGASRTRAAAPDSGRRAREPFPLGGGAAHAGMAPANSVVTAAAAARTGRIDRMELPPWTAAAVGLTADDGPSEALWECEACAH